MENNMDIMAFIGNKPEGKRIIGEVFNVKIKNSAHFDRFLDESSMDDDFEKNYCMVALSYNKKKLDSESYQNLEELIEDFFGSRQHSYNFFVNGVKEYIALHNFFKNLFKNFKKIDFFLDKDMFGRENRNIDIRI